MKKKAAQIVDSAIIGMDFRTVLVNGRVYVIMPPTIHKIAGAGYYLSEIGDGNNIKECIQSLSKVKNAAYALSWLIQGDDNLAEELSYGTFDEIVNALDEAYSLISVENFLKLSGLAKSVANLTANQK